MKSNMPGVVLITGATGAIGPRVVSALDQAGCQVRTLSVDAPAAGMFPQSVQVLIGDVNDQAAVHSAMQGADAVVHLAALLHIDNPSPEMCEKYERINVSGTSSVVDAAVRTGVRRVVLASTIAVYGPSDGLILNEASPTRPDTFYARTKLAAEQIVLNARCADGQPLGTVLRLGAVYGSRIKGNYERLTRALAGNRFLPVGNGLNRHTLVYDKDVGRAVMLAVSHPAAAGRLFNVTDGEFHATNKIIESICLALGRRQPRFSVPMEPMRVLAGFIEKGSRAMGIKSPVTKAMIDKFTEDMAVDGSLIKNELGFMPEYNLQIGWEETIREMRQRGAL